MTTIRVEIDQSLCQSARYCLRTAPAIFALGDDDIAGVKDADGLPIAGPIEVPTDQAGLLESAAWECPAAAISIT
ncbi:ferredoxin [Nocardia sp. NPDC058058]|uniref:ferredoxin n=1 Tax=Nocardia sp. NPDC058058 TaxID=3346317 RepID=UPI0036DB4420